MLGEGSVRRFSTALELGDELNRFLAGKPIFARPVGVLARSWRWCKRNTVAAALMLTVVASLTAGVVTSSYFAASASREAKTAIVALQQTELERKRVERVNKFFMDEVFGLADTSSFDRAGISLVEALNIAAAKIDQRFSDDPELRVVIQGRLGEIYRAMDEPQRAIEQLEKASATWQQLAGPLDPRFLKTRSNLGIAFYNAGRFTEASNLLRSTLADQTKALGAGHPDTLDTGMHLGIVLMEMLDPKSVSQAESTYRNALREWGPRDSKTFDAMSGYSWTLRWNGKNQLALELGKTSADGLRETLGEDSIRTMYAIYNYASCLGVLQQYAESAKTLKGLLAAPANSRQRHVDTLYTSWRYADYSRASGDPDAAIAVLNEVYANLDAIKATNNWRRCNPLINLTQALTGLGDNHRLAEIRNAAYEIYANSKKKSNREIEPKMLNHFAWELATSPVAELRNGKWAVELATDACTSTSYKDANHLASLAGAYAETGDFDLAVKWSEKSLELTPKEDTDAQQQRTAALAKYTAHTPMRQELKQDDAQKRDGDAQATPHAANGKNAGAAGDDAAGKK